MNYIKNIPPPEKGENTPNYIFLNSGEWGKGIQWSEIKVSENTY